MIHKSGTASNNMGSIEGHMTQQYDVGFLYLCRSVSVMSLNKPLLKVSTF